MEQQITFDKRNYRKHSKKNKDIIKKSLQELGAGRSVLIDADGSLIAGNGVYEQAKALKIPVRVIESDGSELVVVKRTDLKTEDEKRRKLALADNAASDLSEWDIPVLQADWSKDALANFGVELPEFEAGDEMSTEEAKDVQEDDFDEEKDKVETVCKKGDIWLLGQHRLMCGDSTNAEDVAALLDGESVSMLLTDPPYGMHLDADFSSIKGRLSGETKGNKYDAVIGDNDDFKPELITTLFDNIDCKECFLFGADYFAELLPHKNDGSWLVWDKRKESQANAIGSEFELIWSKTKHKRRVLRHDWFGFLSSQNGSDARHRVHPTQKPITLLADIINQWGGKAQSIADLYGGSGSTLIACEQLNRKCYMMELDPHYCDVIIARWEKLTGQKATRL